MEMTPSMLCAILIAVGLVLLAIGLWMLMKERKKKPDMIRAPGEFGGFFGFTMATILGLACMAFGILAAVGVLEVNL